tara:strand:- start:155 stop:1087 length:933 start_codon:yes stop_codon:yes gene_type:complete
MVKKINLYKNYNIKNNDKSSIILIGSFDGLHLGHRKLFERAKKLKFKTKCKIGVFTFDPIPKMFFSESLKNYRISNFNEKIKILKNFNVDFVINQAFNKKFSRIKCNDFIKNILIKRIGMKYIYVSNNFKFGNKREGDVKLLQTYQKKYNYKVIKPSPLKIKNKVISSSLIRKLLQDGNLNTANKYLNRLWSVEGVVKKGRQLGKKIGFPTCNIDMKDYVISKLGVYAVKINLTTDNKIYKGIANLGIRPTFNQKKILLEVNIFNFNKKIYGRRIRVEFVKFIRGEKKFENINNLKKQIKLDIKKAKQVN